jgi:hypothetical protein
MKLYDDAAGGKYGGLAYLIQFTPGYKDVRFMLFYLLEDSGDAFARAVHAKHEAKRASRRPVFEPEIIELSKHRKHHNAHKWTRDEHGHPTLQYRTRGAPPPIVPPP